MSDLEMLLKIVEAQSDSIRNLTRAGESLERRVARLEAALSVTSDSLAKAPDAE